MASVIYKTQDILVAELKPDDFFMIGLSRWHVVEVHPVPGGYIVQACQRSHSVREFIFRMREKVPRVIN